MILQPFSRATLLRKNLLSPNGTDFTIAFNVKESVSTFAANLKHLASTCNFGTHLNEALRDRFVCGLRSKEIQKKFLTEEHNFDEALTNALGAEAAEKDVAAFSQEVATPVNKLGSLLKCNYDVAVLIKLRLKKRFILNGTIPASMGN